MSEHSQLIVPGRATSGSLIEVDDDWDEVYAVLAKMPGLLHVLDPARLSASAGVRNPCQAMGEEAQITWTRAGIVRNASGEGFNNHVTLDFTTPDHDLMIGPGTITGSFSMLGVFMIDADIIAGTNNSYLLTNLGYADGHDIVFNFFGNSGKGLNFSPEVNTASNALSVALASLGALVGDTALVFGCSFDNTPASGSKTGRIWLQSVTAPVGTKNNFMAGPNLGPSDQPLLYWSIGSLRYDSLLGLVGKSGMIAIFERGYHMGTAIRVPGESDTTDILLMQELCDAYKSKYAIP